MSDLDVRFVVLDGLARQVKGSRPTVSWKRSFLRAASACSPEELRAWARTCWAEAGAHPGADARGVAACWALAAAAVPGTPPLLADWALKRAKAGAVADANAAIAALGAIARGPERPPEWEASALLEGPEAGSALADEAIAQLQRLRVKLQHRTMRKRLDEELRLVAEARGLSREGLQDLVVPDAGLDAGGSRRFPAGAHDVYVFLGEDGGVELTIHERATGRLLAEPPKALRQQHFAAYQEARAIQKALADALSTQKQRLESALASQRAWTSEAWRQVFGRHPLMRHLASRLLWAIWLDGRRRDTVALAGGVFVDATGDTVLVPEEAELRLLHPALVSAEALRAWQQAVVARRWVQPFKQVFREVFRPGAAELATSSYSERFEGLALPHRTLQAQLRARGWRGFSGIGPTGHWGQRELEGHGLAAVLGFHGGGHSDAQRQLVVLERLEFYPDPLPADAFGTSPRVPLGGVAPVAFSEALRDVALVIAAAAASGALRRDAKAAAGTPVSAVLGGVAEARAALLRELLPMWGLAERVRLSGHAALVEAGGHPFRLALDTGEAVLESDGRVLELDGLERGDAPLYWPHEGADAATASVFSTLGFLARFGARR